MREFGEPSTKKEMIEVCYFKLTTQQDLADSFLYVGQFLSLAQERLLSTFGDYHMNPMLVGLFILSTAAIALSVKARLLTSSYEKSKQVVPSIGIAFVLYLGSFFATSFIEEEHEYWYFMSTTFVLLLAIR